VLDGEVIDDGLDAGNLSSVGCGERAGGFAADLAVESDDSVLDRGLDGFGAEGAISDEAALHGRGESGVVGGWRRALAGGQTQGDCEGGADQKGGAAMAVGEHETSFVR
jgi:hypothetical protein